MEDGNFLKHVKKKHKRYAILSLKKPEYDLLMHATYDDDNNKYFYLQSFDKEGRLIDEKLANQRTIESIESDAFFQFLIIKKEGFKVFAYSDNENTNIDYKKTKVVIEEYEIDSIGQFNLSSKDSVFLDKPLFKYSKFDVEPEPDDPVYKYWTLW
ncbi:hypothetical protein [Marivirga harenae]|uniref:hypothetical protein n=1 Tax=Marivirga harenae TaxID=2010992 RepID=UPI0026DFFEF9|nr:hypothetical protein [Marivirga harenae]WKV10938.1 hypothetical protein Q3Y49_12015 [Marivirga harenae]